MSKDKLWRLLATTACLVALVPAPPAEALGGPTASPGLLERLVSWAAESWILEASEIEDAITGDLSGLPPPLDDEDPDVCRDYAVCVDPNG